MTQADTTLNFVSGDEKAVKTVPVSGQVNRVGTGLINPNQKLDRKSVV